MRIAQVAPLAESVPPKLYGGTERVVSYLTEELVAMGHDVTLFASGDSITAARLHAVVPTATRLAAADPFLPIVLQVQQVFDLSATFDIIHFHIDYVHNLIFDRTSAPFVTTMHGRMDCPDLVKLVHAYPYSPLISISDSQRLPIPNANWLSTIHHGLPLNLLRPQPCERPYLAFLGRISPQKRPDRAIRIAAASGLPLHIAAKIDPIDTTYYQTVIAPMIRANDATLIGEISEDEKSTFLSGAKALLMPIDWPEPFGLVMIEAMACGTPVIAYDQGSVSEIIDHGVTGYIVNSEAAAVAAVARVNDLDRAVIRATFEKRFAVRTMAEKYVASYSQLLRNR